MLKNNPVVLLAHGEHQGILLGGFLGLIDRSLIRYAEGLPREHLLVGPLVKVAQQTHANFVLEGDRTHRLALFDFVLHERLLGVCREAQRLV
jgi:hypothetical protein